MLKNNHFVRTVALLLCLSLVLGFVPGGLLVDLLKVNAVPNEPVNLITNGDFEKSDTAHTDWAPIAGAGKLSITSGISGNATNIMKLAQGENAGNIAVMSNVFAVEAGAKYDVTMSVLHDISVNPKNQFTICVFWYRAGVQITPSNYAKEYLGDPAEVKVPALSGNWEKATATLTAPAGAAQALLRFTVNNKHAQCVYVDDVVIKKQGADAPAAGQSNVILSDDFNTSYSPEGSPTVRIPEGWTSSKPKSATLGTANYERYDNTPALFVQAAGYLTSPVFDVEEGGNYTVTYITKKYKETIGTGGYVAVKFTNNDGTAAAAVTFPVEQLREWTEVTQNVTAPAGMTKAYIEVGAANVTGDPTFAVENLVVSKVGAAPAPTTPTTPSATEPAEPGDYVISEDFDAPQASGWTASNNFSGNAVNTYPNYYEGSLSLFFQVKSVWAKSPAFAVIPGMVYEANFVTQRHGGSAPAGYAKIIFLNAAGEQLSGKTADIGTGIQFNGNKQVNWKAESVSALAPEGAVSAYVEFGCGADGSSFGVDALKVTEKDGTGYDPDATEPEETRPAGEMGAVINGGFENGQSSWGGGAGQGASVSVSTDAYSGNSALLLTADKELGRATNSLTQTVYLGDAKGVKLSAMAKRLSGEDVGYLGLWFYDANNNLVPADTAYTVNIAMKEEWTEYVLMQPVPEGAVSVTIKFGNHSGKTMSYLVDDVKLEEYEVAVDTNTYVYTEKFESIADSGWTASNEFVGLDVGTYPSYFEGTRSLFFQAKNVWAKSAEFAVTAGKAYAAIFVSQRHDGGAPAGYAKLIFLDANGEVIGEKQVGVGTGLKFDGNKQGNWKEEYVAQIAPAGAVSAYLEFGRGEAGGTFGIDSLKVREIEASEFDPADFEIPYTDQNAGVGFELVNGDFANGTEGWKAGFGTGASHEVVTGDEYLGGSAILFSADKAIGSATNTFTQTLKVGDVKAYQLTVISKRLTGEDVGFAGLWFYDANDNLLPENTAFSVNTARTTDWREETLIQAVPEGAVTVVLKFGNHSGKTFTYLVDDIKLEEYTGPADAIKPAVPSQPSGGGGVIWEPVDPSQLNASFEELGADGLPKNWRLSATACKIMTPADAPLGKNVLQFTTSGSGGTVRSMPIKAEPGKTYEVKLTAKDIEGSGARIGLYMFDAEGKRLDDYCVVVTTDGSGKWKMYTAIGVAPENVAVIEAWVWYATKVEATVQVDGLLMRESDVKVKPIYVPDPYTPPTTDELLANISNEYPRVFFDGKEDAKQTKLRRFNTLKTKYGFTWNQQYNQLLETAEAYLQETQVRVTMNTGKHMMMDIYPVLKDPSDLSYRDKYIETSLNEEGKLYDNPYTGWGALFTEPLADRMRVLSLAYIMTGKTMYSDRAISYAMQVADWKVWGDEYWLQQKNLSAEASTGWMMAGMVAVYDMCYDQMTEEQRAKLERNIIDQGLVPLSKAAKPNSTVNGHMMMLGGMLSGCAAIMNESNIEEIKPYLDVALTWAHNALSNFAYSGNTEGHYYTDFGLETFIPGLCHLYNVTGLEELINHPFLSEMLPYWTVMWAESNRGTHPNYSDGSVGAYMKLPMAVLSSVTNNPIIDGFLISAGGTGDMFENLVYLNADPKPEYLTDHVGIVEIIGYGVLRTGFASDSMMMTLKANDSQMNHNHFDQNSIQFNVGGNWLITDPGAGSYYNGDRAFWTNSGHSTIMVDGNAQLIKGTASIRQVFNNNLYGYIVGSAPRTYGDDYDGAILTTFDRHAIQINHTDKPYYVVIDDLVSDKDRTYTWHMYNGYRGTFAVDGQEVLEGGSAMGNSISVALGKEVLNLKFVDDNKLTIEDYIHKSNGNPVGMGIAASTAATKAHQFMTLISTDSNPNVNFYDFTKILNNRRFTVPDYMEEGDINWDSSMPLGQESVKTVTSGGATAVFFRGNGIGDWISYPFTIEEDGVYNINLIMLITDGACQVKATIDDTYETVVKDFSGLPVTTDELAFGELALTAGEHRVKIEIVGKGLDKDYAAGWYLIDAVGMDISRVGVETPPVKDLNIVETYDNAEALGALVNYIDDKHDLLMWNRTAGAANAGLLNTDAQQASVLGLINGSITEGFAATGATAMTYDGKALFLAEKKVDIVASNTGWQIISAEAQTIQLTAIAPELDYVVTVNGAEVDAKIENGILSIAVEAGETAIAVVVEEPEIIEPTEPEETDPTEPSEEPTEAPTVAPTEPVDNGSNDATLWIVVAVIVVLLAGAVTGLVVFLKKRKAA